MDRQPLQSSLITVGVIAGIISVIIWAVSSISPIIIDKPDKVEPCTHETWNPEVDDGLIQLYIPVISKIAGQTPNQVMKVAYCIECGALSTYPDDVYYYSELWDEVFNEIPSN